MLEYFTQDQEALAGLRGPWFPPLSSCAEPVTLQRMAITQHDFCRYEQTPVTMNLHHVSRNGTRVEYLVQIVAMKIVEDWTQNSEPALSPDILHTAGDGHDSMEGWSRAWHQNHKLVHGHQKPRSFDRHDPRKPALTLKARPEATFTITEQGKVCYQTSSDLANQAVDDGTFQWVTHRPTAGQKLVVNTWTQDSLVATHFMSNGVPVTYNLRMYGAYIRQRHRDEFDTLVRELLHNWYRTRLSRFNRNAGSVSSPPTDQVLGQQHTLQSLPHDLTDTEPAFEA